MSFALICIYYQDITQRIKNSHQSLTIKVAEDFQIRKFQLYDISTTIARPNTGALTLTYTTTTSSLKVRLDVPLINHSINHKFLQPTQ
jgi:hypothetical protein